jgi:protoporphyrin/coproporphyrin ferrochelatase
VNLFSDRAIIKLPLQPIMARLIARSRSKKVAERYQAIGGGSPILKLTEEQAQLLEDQLIDRGLDCRCYVGMTYWHPFIRETVDRIVKDGYKQILALSLFPHYSRATSGACLGEMEKTVKGMGADFNLVAIDSWYDDPGYITALVEKINLGLAGFSTEDKKRLTVVFSAHSLPEEFVDQGDPYPEHLGKTIDAVLERLEPINWRLTYQSRSGPVKWLEPQTEQVIEELAATGVKNVLIVPISFVSDHIETLHEIDIMYKELAVSRGIKNFVRTPSLNGSDTFIQALAGIVLKKLGLCDNRDTANRDAAGGER